MHAQESRGVFCTLFEGKYHHGVAALLNSLLSNGFKGTFVIGWRGALPPWEASIPINSHGLREVGGVEVVFKKIESPWILAHLKPHFMLDVLTITVPSAEYVCYADPDVLIDAPWDFFERWLRQGVGICEDCCFPTLGIHHYLRRCWVAFAKDRLNLPVDESISRGYNSGFVGVRRERSEFLGSWQLALEHLPELGVSLAELKPGTRLDSFFGTDQDALNIAVMAHAREVSSFGPEGMGFSPGLSLMWHAADSPKPWGRSYIKDAIVHGRRVQHSHRRYWHYAKGPVRSWTDGELALRRFDLQLAIILTRFYHSA